MTYYETGMNSVLLSVLDNAQDEAHDAAKANLAKAEALRGGSGGEFTAKQRELKDLLVKAMLRMNKVQKSECAKVMQSAANSAYAESRQTTKTFNKAHDADTDEFVSKFLQ